VARFRRSRRTSGRGARRKVKWINGQFAIDSVTFDANPDQDQWTSWWLRYPSTQSDPFVVNPGVTPEDETLVRLLVNAQIIWEALVPAPNVPLCMCLGAIAFDGGEFPDFYDLAIFQRGVSLVAPPNPITEADDDWIIRLPFCFGSDGQIQTPGSEIFLESKAMRKLPPGTGILVVAAFRTLFDVALTPTVTLMSDWRAVIKSGQAADPR